MHPRYYASGHDRLPEYVGRCRCGCVFPVVHEGDADWGAGVPAKPCPECLAWTLLDRRHRPEPAEAR